MTARWSLAVLAHNEAANIAATLRSIRAAEPAASLAVSVLANGCRDRTADVVRDVAADWPALELLEIPHADKAHAWNHHVHRSGPVAETCFFMDGDVRLLPGALSGLAAALAEQPLANAAGGLPGSGRDRQAWTQRMLAKGTLAGGLYALRGSFVERLRQRGIRIPRGVIGEDWLLSLLVRSDLRPLAACGPGAHRVAFAREPGFVFRSLDPWRPGDYPVYLRRLWRYALRDVQFEMLLGGLFHEPPEALPPDVETLYRQVLPPSRLKWAGKATLLRFLAVQRIRQLRAAARS